VLALLLIGAAYQLSAGGPASVGRDT
jgi:hypothetical protein